MARRTKLIPNLAMEWRIMMRPCCTGHLPRSNHNRLQRSCCEEQRAAGHRPAHNLGAGDFKHRTSHLLSLVSFRRAENITARLQRLFVDRLRHKTLMSQSLAILGGTAVRTRPFTAWPVFGEAEETRLLRALRSGKWGKLNGDGGRRVRAPLRRHARLPSTASPSSTARSRCASR